ncbi:MAG: D-glycero-beta-D-manno-heptose-7-phosphate kinase [Alcaligenes pakistanensis]
MMEFPSQAVAASRVLVVGDVMLDRYWFGDVERISPEAPVPVVKMGRVEDRLGGAANVARNIAALGAQASLLGVIGQDEAGKTVRELAKEDHVQAHWVQDPLMPTSLKLRVLGRQQQLLRVDFEESPASSALDQLHQSMSDLLDQHQVLVLSDYAKGALGKVESLIALARAKNIPILVDPKGKTYERYQGATILTPNRLEMQEAVGAWKDEDDLMQRAQNLRRKLDLECLLITRSEQGMTLFTEQGREHVDAQAQEVFDVSGAGDTVLATLAVMRAAGLDWLQAMRWANRAGGIVVGKLGTSIVTAKELA